MGNEFIFYAQIASIVVFLITLFTLYRLLVSQKDATIELLKERIESLKNQLLESKNMSPDILAERLSKRVEMLKEELKTLSKDHESKKENVLEKELELKKAEEEIFTLKKQLDEAQESLEDYLCPYCKAPMTIHDYFPDTAEINGREIDFDHEVVEYECGFTKRDGKIVRKCGEPLSL